MGFDREKIEGDGETGSGTVQTGVEADATYNSMSIWQEDTRKAVAL